MTIEAVDRASAVRRVLLIEMALNLVVAGAKLWAGLTTGSLAILSDAVHSLVDAGANVIGFSLVGIASAPPDSSHPYGHRKVEVFAASALGLLIGGTAMSFGVDAGRALLYGREAPAVTALGFAVIGGTLVVNVFITLYERHKAEQLESPYLYADAAHTAADVLTTIAVLLAYTASHFGYSWADPIGAVLVLVIVARIAWAILSENVSILVDAAAIPAENVEKLANGHPDVRGCHRVRSRGPADSAQVDLHLVLDGDLTLERAHDIAHEVEDLLRESIPGIADIVVHTEPDGHEPEPL